MCVSERNIGYWDTSLEFGVRRAESDFYPFISQGRAADLFKITDIHYQPIFHLIKISNVIKCLEFPFLCPLPVIQMQEGKFIFKVCNSSGNKAVHPAAYKDYG